MLHWRLLGGDEKAQLQELNARLYEYVSRVRQLELENQQLLDELHSRRGEEDWWAAWQGRYQAEVGSLRRQLEELSWDTSLAEGERDSLWRELQELRRLSGEARAVRGQLDAELGAQRQQLEEALGARAGLEALLGRLQDEHQRLLEGHARDVRELRERVATFSMRFRARQPPREPQLDLQEVHDSYALLVAESWQETCLLYQDKVRELEEKVRLGQESRQEAEEEKRLCQLQVESLHREVGELDQLRQRLEEELLRMRAKYDLEMEENQRVIDFLEDEKQNLTMTLTDRLKDYQDLLQVKTGLHLEVATYRALLEGESNPEILVWTEHIQNVPREVRNTLCQYTDSILQRENKRNIYSREKITSSNKNISAPYANRSTFFGPRATIVTGSAPRKNFLGPSHSSSSTLRQETSYERTAKDQSEHRTLPTTHGLLRSTEPQVKVTPDRQKTESRSSITTYLTQESTSAQRPSHQQKDVRMSTSASTRSHEMSVLQGKETEERASTEERKQKIELTKPRQEEKMFDSKEKASEERNLRWEGMTKLDKEARERESMQWKGKTKGGESIKERTTIFGEKREIEIPVTFEGQGHGEAPQADKGELSVKDAQAFQKKGTDDSKTKWTDEKGLKFKVDASDAVDSTKDSTRKTIAENIVSSILQQFVQPSDSETSAGPSLDTKVTYMERKELPGEGKAKTEIIVESKLLEEIDVSDEDSLKHLLSKGAKEVEIKGKSAESMIGDIINLGLKGREGRAKVVNVEIVEEPLAYVTDEKADFSTPFEIEEVDDVSLGFERHYSDEEGNEETSISSGNQFKKTEQPHQNVTHFEEVTEAGDSEGEQRYFVSTPDEYSGSYDKDEDSVYGQIHVEEESTIKYSWQDEVSQSTEKRRKRSNLPGDEFSSTSEIFSPEEDVDSSHPKGDQLHTETIVIEKEIKIPHEFQTSIKELSSKDPKHQLVETIGQLEGSLPESVREELSVLTKESKGDTENISVKKFEKTTDGGSVTIVAEVNLSKTLDANQFDLDQLRKDNSSKVEKILQSAVLDSSEKHQAREPESPDSKNGKEVSGSSIESKRWASRQMYSSSSDRDGGGGGHYTAEHVFCQGPVSATVEVSSPRGFAQSHVLEDINQSVRHIKIGPTEIRRTERIFYEGPASEVVEMDVTNREETSSTARGTRETTIFFPTRKEAKVHIASDDGDWRDSESKKDKEASVSFQVSAAQDHQARGEQVTFDKTVQLQRMVDQRSVISDEKKIAVLYLDKEEEEEENDGHWF
ncbi:synemin [Notamacropus eugenii]|uniref:synemin n=1 Tax=Notamacropus eugenii TaxID=9315 RepID=UPI003B67F259